MSVPADARGVVDDREGSEEDDEDVVEGNGRSRPDLAGSAAGGGGDGGGGTGGGTVRSLNKRRRNTAGHESAGREVQQSTAAKSLHKRIAVVGVGHGKRSYRPW